MKNKSIIISLGLLTSMAAFANSGTGSANSGAVSGNTGMANGADSSNMNNLNQTTNPQGGTATNAPMGGTASEGWSAGSGVNSSAPSPTNNMGTALSDRQSIMDAQQALVNQGFAVSIDGRNGPQTSGAIRQYQARNGLPETGTLDSSTQESLRSGGAAQPSATDTSAQ